MNEAVNNVVNDSTKINISLGYTLNLGNFQSMRIDIGVTDARRDGENIQEAFDRVYSFVEAKLVEKVNEGVAEIDSK